ncbi:MAG: hypothetical protein VX072_06935, partial [Pseudomonadota bacterium]|nr:hypothetical protein [Pseudomonadota bacterium]
MSGLVGAGGIVGHQHGLHRPAADADFRAARPGDAEQRVVVNAFPPGPQEKVVGRQFAGDGQGPVAVAVAQPKHGEVA